jgi:CBS domain-containing protein
MDAEIVTQDYFEVDIDDRLSDARSIFERENSKAIVVTEDGEYAGVLTQKRLLGSHMEDKTKVSAITESAPRIDRHDDVREVARMLVEGGTQAAPVFEGEKLVGVVTADAVLESVLGSLDALSVADIYTTDVVTVTEEEDIGSVLNRLREHGVSRLPVVNENGYLTGVVTTYDVVDFVTRNMQRTTRGDRSGQNERMLDLPAYDIMTSPVETTIPGASMRDAVERMLANDYGGLIVTPEEDDRLVAGVVTKTDVLRALSIREEHHLDVQITNIDLLDTISRQEIREAIESVASKYRDMQVQHAHVRFHKHKEKLRGTPLIQAQIRLRTNKGQAAGSGEGYGAENGFYVALDKLERNVLELKGINRDAEQRGQLLRKLGKL